MEKHADFLLGLIARRPDLTLDEALLAMHRHKIPGSRSAMWRFLKRHNVTFKKSLRTEEQERADVARARQRWMREQGIFDPAHLVFVDETAANTKMVRLSGRMGQSFARINRGRVDTPSRGVALRAGGISSEMGFGRN